ncbi:hypothetical protein Acr_17g0003830 [Actinidia rufa]|uniref:Secreted protein n=1 Tax=Actinidia rufa TaxID=165716 RepID=A0A7J0G204_9ERIC|nr:hypothetical protein Acr_17g0003830 [Actinidia rufa]
MQRGCLFLLSPLSLSLAPLPSSHSHGEAAREESSWKNSPSVKLTSTSSVSSLPQFLNDEDEDEGKVATGDSRTDEVSRGSGLWSSSRNRERGAG